MQDFTMPYGLDIVIGKTSRWNKGVGSAVAKMLIQYLFARLHVAIVFVYPMTWKARAIQCYEKCGFRLIKIIKEREFLNGAHKDSLIMCLSSKDKVVRIKQVQAEGCLGLHAW